MDLICVLDSVSSRKDITESERYRGTTDGLFLQKRSFRTSLNLEKKLSKSFLQTCANIHLSLKHIQCIHTGPRKLHARKLVIVYNRVG